MLLNEDTPRNMWQMVRVEQVFPSDDELVRSVQVKTSTTSFGRPITKICPPGADVSVGSARVTLRFLVAKHNMLVSEINHYICTRCTICNANSLYVNSIYQLTFRLGVLFVLNALWFI